MKRNFLISLLPVIVLFVLASGQQKPSAAPQDSLPPATRQGSLRREGEPIGAEPQKDWKQIGAGGRLRIGHNLPPGAYVLQVVVTDKLAKEKQQIATQWTDFEIVK